VSLPNSLSEIGESVFSGCKSLKSVVIPVGVTHIGENAFFLCEDLTHVYVPDTVSEIGNGAFLCGDSVTLHVSSGSYAESYASRERYLSYDNEVKGIWNQITVKTVTKSQEGSASGSLFLECSEKLAKKFLRKKTFKEQRQMG
ncbi:MAG: leucine-rich repeat domain-containing protein, partial [Candidatus Heritagella sp.]|nr:leucine-rich repeat domain-containing protein [Candidatus Heritagella sp.]